MAVCLVLAVALMAIYGQTLGFEFANFDDDLIVYKNQHILQGLTPGNIVRAFTQAHFHMWLPLTTLSHLADVQLYGTWAGGHHATNVLIAAADDQGDLEKCLCDESLRTASAPRRIGRVDFGKKGRADRAVFWPDFARLRPLRAAAWTQALWAGVPGLLARRDGQADVCDRSLRTAVAGLLALGPAASGKAWR
jgi:hypothetical protein